MNKLATMEKNKKFNKASVRLVLEYLKSKQSEGIGTGRLRRIADVADHLLKTFHFDFSKLNQRQLEEMAIWMNCNQEWKPWTIYTYIAVLKNFADWLNDRYALNLSLKRVRAPSVKNSLMPDHLLTEEDLNKILNATDNLQVKLLIGMLYESGARISEILTLRIQNISWSGYGAKISVKGKTGQRVIPIIWYSSMLRQFLETHPQKDNPEACIWYLRKNREIRPLVYGMVRMQIARLCKRVGITKRVNLHLFRHTRLTELASTDLGEQTLKALAGWSGGSKMAQTYIHLSNKNVEDSLLAKAYGIKVESNNGSEGLKMCSRCNEANPHFARLCQRCKTPLNEKELVHETMSSEKMKGIEDWSRTLTAFLKVVEKKHPDIWKDMNETLEQQQKM
jgi:integrase/recombinase XerD